MPRTPSLPCSPQITLGAGARGADVKGSNTLQGRLHCQGKVALTAPHPCPTMPSESCQSRLSVGTAIDVFSLRGQRFSGFLMLFPAKFSCPVSTNCPGITGIFTIITIERALPSSRPPTGDRGHRSCGQPLPNQPRTIRMKSRLPPCHHSLPPARGPRVILSPWYRSVRRNWAVVSGRKEAGL